MTKGKNVTKKPDENGRDRDNKADRSDIKKMPSSNGMRGDLKGEGKTPASRTKQDNGK